MLILLLAYSLAQSGLGDGAPISTTIEKRDERASCNDLSSCRTLSNIVWSCLTTIFLCTWASIHPNIAFFPEEKNIGQFRRWVVLPLHSFLTYKLPLFLIALLAPEYILAWSIRQYMMASRIQVKYEDVPGWTRTHGFFVIMGGFHPFEIPTDISSNAISSKSGMTVGFLFSPLDSRENEVPKHPLGIEDIPADILKVIAPTETELKDKGKSDLLAKGIVVVQTLWFVAQCIARGIQHLPLTELEVVTLAYTLMNVFIYSLWWDKPRDVACPIRVYKTSTEGQEKIVEKDGWYFKLFFYILGLQDQYTDISQECKVPMFWLGLSEEQKAGTKAYLGPSILGMGFGAIHCIAWSPAFPSHIELIPWRISCVALIAVPLVATLFCILVASNLLANRGSTNFFDTMASFLLIILLLSAWLYVAARIGTIIMALTTLRSLPSDAFTVVDWTTFIPHI